MTGSGGTIAILYVDGDTTFAERAATVLERDHEEFDVQTVGTVREARERLDAREVDCVVSASELPDGSGLDLLRSVREVHPDLPFIVYTGTGSEGIASEAISAGVTDYLQKEADTGQFTALTDRIVDSVEEYRSEEVAEATERKLHQLAEKSDDVLFVFDADWADLLFINSAYEDVLGGSIGELEGDPHAFLSYVHPDDRPTVRRTMAAVSAGSPEEAEFRIVAGDGDEHLLHVEAKPVLDDGAVTRIVGIVRDITERTRREQAIQALHRTAQEIWRCETPEAVAEVVVDAGRDILEMPINAVHLYDEGDDALIPVAATERAAEFVGEIPTFERGDGFAWEVFETDEARHFDDVSTASGRHNDDTNARSELILPLTDHGVLHVGSPDTGVFDDTDVSLMQTLVAHATSALDQIEHERRLTELQERTQRLMHTATKEATAEAAVEAVHDILNSPSGGVHLVSEEGDTLPPTAVIDTYRESFDPPTYRRDADDPISALVWEAFETGEVVVIDDLRDRVDLAELTPARSVIIHPLGEYGVFIVTGSQSNAFDPSDETYVELVATSLTTALERVQRETNLQDREHALERQNERLEQFTDIVSHDLRNPLNVVEGRLALAREERDSEHLDSIGRATERMNALVTDLLTLAREGDTAMEVNPVDVGTLATECWQNVDTENATLHTPTTLQIRADESQLRQLFENLTRNAVEHGGADVLVTVGDLPNGFYVEDDGPGIPEAEREAVFDAGYSTSTDGTGFGLRIVEQAVDAHDWAIAIADSEAGGTRFEITGVEIVDTVPENRTQQS
jgi:PAS domain S-box-containing protein